MHRLFPISSSGPNHTNASDQGESLSMRMCRGTSMDAPSPAAGTRYIGGTVRNVGSPAATTAPGDELLLMCMSTSTMSSLPQFAGSRLTHSLQANRGRVAALALAHTTDTAVTPAPSAPTVMRNTQLSSPRSTSRMVDTDS